MNYDTNHTAAGLSRIFAAFNTNSVEVAQQIGVSVEIVDGWIAGEVIPQIHITDLTLLFGVARHEIYYPKFINGEPRSVRYQHHTAKYDGYVGNVGIGLKGKRKSIWFPLSGTDWQAVRVQSENKWMSFDTLGNRHVIVNRSAMSHLYMADEAQDHISGDWKIDPTVQVEGIAAEIYELWYEYVFETCLIDESIGDTISEAAAATLKRSLEELDEQDVYDAVDKIQVRTIDGRKFSVHWNTASEDFSDFLTDLQCYNRNDDDDLLPQTITFSSDDFDVTIPVNNIAMITAPLTKMIDLYIENFVEDWKNDIIATVNGENTDKRDGEE